jgi:hypothetical protein
MKRRGVVVLSNDRSACAFVDDILAEMAPAERPSIRVQTAEACLAEIGPRPNRTLLVVDGEPPDRSASVLLESMKVNDPQLPILFVRHDWDRPPVVYNGVCVCRGPLVARTAHALIIAFLDDEIL